MIILYAKELKEKLKNIPDDMEVVIDTVDGFKPVHSIREDSYEYFSGIDFDYQPIEETAECFVLVLGHDIFGSGVMSDRELFDKCCDDCEKLICIIAKYIKKGLTDDGQRKLSKATAEKWNKILFDLKWRLPVTNKTAVHNFSVDSNGALHFHDL